jgi:hypothetical protein
MRTDRVTGDRWWRIFWFVALTHPRARNGDYRKYPSQPVTRHPSDAQVNLPPVIVEPAMSLQLARPQGGPEISETTL